MMLQLHARHHQQYLNDPLQLAFSPLPPPGTFIRETSSFIQPPLQPTAAATTQTTTATGAANPAGTTGNNRRRRNSNGGSGVDGSSGGGWPSLPPNVHVLSLQWRSCSSLLVRLVNIFQAGEEDPQVPLSPSTAAGGAAAAAVGSSDDPIADTTQAGQHSQVPLSDTATVRRVWTLFSWGSNQGSDAAVGAWCPGLSVVDVTEATLFGQRPLTESDLKPALQGWPLGDSITQWDPTLWPPAGSGNTSRSSSRSSSSNSMRSASPFETAADGAPAEAEAEAEAGPYSFLSNRIVGPMDAAKHITLAPMQVWLAVSVMYACLDCTVHGGRVSFVLYTWPARLFHRHQQQRASKCIRGDSPGE
jgi:hypothetical protein